MNPTIELEESPEPFEAHFLAATPVHYNDTIQFVDVSFPAPVSWNWNFGDLDNTNSTLANPEFYYPLDPDPDVATSYYDVTLIASTGLCTDTLVKTIEVYNVRSEIPQADTTFIVGEFFERFEVYPNPTDGRIMLDIKIKQVGEVKLRLTDMNGKGIRKYALEGSDEYFQNFDLGQLAAGVYIFTGKYKDCLLYTSPSPRD